MLRERVPVQEMQTALHRGWRLRIDVLRAMRARPGRALGWQYNQLRETPSSPSLAMTAEAQAQQAWHCEELIARQLA